MIKEKSCEGDSHQKPRQAGFGVLTFLFTQCKINHKVDVFHALPDEN